MLAALADRIHNEVVLDVLAVLAAAVQHQVDAGIDVLLGQLSVLGDVGDLRTAGAEEIVGDAGLHVARLDLRLGIGPSELQREVVLPGQRRSGRRDAGR